MRTYYSIISALLIFLGAFAIITGIALLTKDATEPEPWEISGKYEVNGKCFVEVWHEVTPEEYIGLDVGDEYHPQD